MARARDEGERGLREQAGASWAWGVGRAVREKGLAQGREWAVAGWAAGEGWTGLPGFLGLGLVWVWV